MLFKFSLRIYKYSANNSRLSSENFKSLLDCTSGASECHLPDKNPNDITPFDYLSDCKINTQLSEDECNLLNKVMYKNYLLF